jgi:hypothetical protein
MKKLLIYLLIVSSLLTTGCFFKQQSYKDTRFLMVICVSKCPRKCIHKVEPLDTSKPLILDKPESKTGCASCALNGSCGSAQ